MKKFLSLALAFTFSSLGLISLLTQPVRAQQVASVGKSISDIKEEYERLLAVDRDPSTPTEVREINHEFLEKRRTQLRTAIERRLGALRKYQASTGASLSGEESIVVGNSISALERDLSALTGGPAITAAPATAPRARLIGATLASRSSSATPQPTQSGQVSRVSYQDEAKTSAEPEASVNGGTPTKALALEITSPDRDRTVHVGEVEMEVSIGDEDIDDLMVAVYTPASAKPKSARVLNVKRSDKGTKSVIVSLSKGDNRIEVSDLKRSEIKAERKLTFTSPEAPGIGSTAGSNAAPASQGAGGAAPETPSEPSRLVGLLLGGSVISQQTENLSQADPFLGFLVGYDDIGKGGRAHFRIQSIFQVQPKKEEAPVEGTGEGADNNGDGNPDPADFRSFLASRKTFDVEMSLFYDWPGRKYLFFGGKHSDPNFRLGFYGAAGGTAYMSKSELKGDDNVKVENTNDTGATTANDQVELDTERAKVDNDIDIFYEGGLIGNFTKGAQDGKTKLFMQVKLGYGRYEALAGLNPGKTGFLNDSRNRFVGKLRIFPFFLDRDPEGGADASPMFGVEINAGRGPDQIKFFTGVATAFKLANFLKGK